VDGVCPGGSPAPTGAYCAPLTGVCIGPEGAIDEATGAYNTDINNKSKPVHGANYTFRNAYDTNIIESGRVICEASCTGIAECVGYDYAGANGACSVYGPNVAQNASHPWTGWPSKTTKIDRADGQSGTSCYAVAGRN